jgi:hypothetical protein
MKIIIESLPHASQRYPTCGDWYFEPDGTLVIKVSEEMGPDSCFLVAVHELVEVWLSTKRGVTVQQVDDFDIAYEKAHRVGGTLEGERMDESEPGDDPNCPVFEEHQLATVLERLLCERLGITWKQHDETVNALP